MVTETLTARTEFEDGRVSCTLVTEDGPPTWIKIFGNMDLAMEFADDHDLEFINLCELSPGET